MILTEEEIKKITEPKKPFLKPNFWKLLILALFLTLLTVVMIKESFEEVTIQKADGTYQLKANKIRQLQKDTAKFSQAEQYVLIAEVNGWYPCATCVGADSVFLFKGEVWKYGVTINGEKGRYNGAKNPLNNDLEYIVQFRGNIETCLKLERIQIATYPLLPENLKRIVKLGRPPFNPINS
ncbi:MAG: hypothetical protein EAZ97_11565 [Bacteroidetes bacterium]|nr:MAG: hypothetical protein EAZ97_11565 [Bacteroidota bacterium]